MILHLHYFSRDNKHEKGQLKWHQVLPSTFYYKWFCLKVLKKTVEPIQHFGCKRTWSSMRIYDAKPVLSTTINSLCFSNVWMFKRIKVLLLCELFFPKQFFSICFSHFLFHVNILANVQKTPLMTWLAVSSLKISVSNLLNKRPLTNNGK